MTSLAEQRRRVGVPVSHFSDQVLESRPKFTVLSPACPCATITPALSQPLANL